MYILNRRSLLKTFGASSISLGALAVVGCDRKEAQYSSSPEKTFWKLYSAPLAQVRLLDSLFADALQVNVNYLKSLSCDRLLSRFRSNAGLVAKAEHYGGWEADALAGHTLGHYLSALAFTFAQMQDPEIDDRINYIVNDLRECQLRHGDGYVGAVGRWLGTSFEVNGKLLFDEVRQGDIRVKYGTLNGGWAPFYVLHKQLAGLLDANIYTGNKIALVVAKDLSAYIEAVLENLSDEQMQQVLDCEFGGIQESFATLYVRTGDQRWMTLARKFRHSKSIDAFVDGKDPLDDLHSNTEIPKFVANALVAYLDGSKNDLVKLDAAWNFITQFRSYANGGNGDQEWFRNKKKLSSYVTDQNCEQCSSYNMLKLTRYLYQQSPQASYFDYFERTHLNHILAAHHPHTGMFAYMTPMMSGAKRQWSKPDSDFWCCVGSGMESNAKHAESIYWFDEKDPQLLVINLYIASELNWGGIGTVSLATDYPKTGNVKLRVAPSAPTKELRIALRKPQWAETMQLLLNNKPYEASLQNGYLLVEHEFSSEDLLEIVIPMSIRNEQIADGGNLHAFFYGPSLLAADMGVEGNPLLEDRWPAVIAASPSIALQYSKEDIGFTSGALSEPLVFKPYSGLVDQRTAIYFPHFTPEQWPIERRRRDAVAAVREAKSQATIDRLEVGDSADETAHHMQESRTELTPYRGLNGRRLKPGGFYSAQMQIAGERAAVYVTYWGEATRGRVAIIVDGEQIGEQVLEANNPGDFFEGEYLIPAKYLVGRDRITLRFEAQPDTRAPSIYGLRIALPTS